MGKGLAVGAVAGCWLPPAPAGVVGTPRTAATPRGRLAAVAGSRVAGTLALRRAVAGLTLRRVAACSTQAALSGTAAAVLAVRPLAAV